jgi:Glycosidases
MRKSGILVLAALLTAAVSCGEKTPQAELTSLTVSPTELSFVSDDASNKLLLVSTTTSWSAQASAGWIHLDKTFGESGGSVSVSVDPNEGAADRTGSISFTGAQSASVSVTQKGSDIRLLTAQPDAFDGNKRSSTTYQLLVYSFADSDGDGVGDFKGIQSKLDYLDALGVTALWLSPVHPSDSYHGYDVTDYNTVNPAFGTEQDFNELVAAAHAKGIKIYLDYVLNHSGKGNAWFQEALANPSSPYRDYYFFSTNPAADYSKFPMLKGTTYKSEEWKVATSGSPTITITSTSEAAYTGSADWNLWMWQDGGEGKELRFKDNGDGTYSQVLAINGKWGILVRKYMNWNTGSKFGTKAGNTTLKENTPMELVAEGADISFTGNGGNYKITLSNTNTETIYYMGCFSDWMPDLNYGDLSTVTENATFKDLAASADKWINLGVDGLRLDAVKHIYGGLDSWNNNSNISFLDAWYQHCNATYKAAGHSDDIFMVGEVWDSHDKEKNYYKGLTSCFEFGYWPLLYRALTNQNAASFVSSVSGFVKDHKGIRDDAQTSFFMTNHDHSSQTGDGEVRAADDLGKNLAKEKQAAAMLLSGPGKPFVYQGEELGYWGNSKGRGDEYLRAPIVWDKAAKDCAKGNSKGGQMGGLGGKVDNSMLTGAISVEAQEADANSLLNTYISWSRLRNTYPALATGEMSAASVSGTSMAAWYMTAGSEKLLVIHNVAGKEVSTTVSDSMANPVALLGSGSVSGTTLTLGPNSSVVFKL